MKKTFITALMVFFVNFVIAQNTHKKDTIIIWKLVPVYDANGNVLMRTKVFHSIPTRKDSIEFGKLYMREIEIAVQAAIDSLKKKNLIKEK